MLGYYEFFAGGGMARVGLGPEWNCLFANDLDPKKAASYESNWGADVLKIADVAALTVSDLIGTADLAWASFPCQDLSLAGAGSGLKGSRSGTFWPFWRLMEALCEKGRGPRAIVLENVCGALTSHEGRDFAAICKVLAGRGYRFGALVIDAVKFLPQSRPRLFIIAFEKTVEIPETLTLGEPESRWHPSNLKSAYKRLSKRSKSQWIWWRLPSPALRNTVLSDLIEDDPKGVPWHTAKETRYLLNLMSPINLRKVEKAKLVGHRMIGTIYRRTRPNEDGEHVQRAEIRFDNIAGCLRTPTGGSSRQTVMIVNRNQIRSRLLSPREAARLMGLSDDYVLPNNYNQTYHLVGDGLVVPVVRFIADNILEPTLDPAKGLKRAA
jgi:DNA (cytosine-5)-methyltransferase 1